MHTINFKNVLILAPHTDDGEFGCGGTIARFKRLGARVTYVAFSSAEESVPEGFAPDILRKEVVKATQTLGINTEDLTVLNFKVRHFPQYRQDILEEMVALNRVLKPDLVLLPSNDDTHQDHLTIAQEGFRAFKKTTMLAYELPWNNKAFPTTCFIQLDKQDLQKKILALDCYVSQRGRSYASRKFITSLAITRGTQVGLEFAEVFDVVRWIVRVP